MFIDHWTFQSTTGTRSLLLPDGCRDLICTRTCAGRQSWRLSPFFASASEVTARENGVVEGFRLPPGTRIDETALLRSLQNCEPDELAIAELISRFTLRTDATGEILGCLQQGHQSVSAAARALGVQTRTLQRQFAESIPKTPKYWLDLARIRRAARKIASDDPLADVAAEFHFADQAHLTRNCHRWLGVTPTQLRTRQDLIAQLSGAAYA